MGRITPDTIERIKERLPVSEVVGRHVKLKRAGREWRALSPFTSEKTPSFFVNDAKAFWHCFSSGRHGNVFDFEMAMTGCDFPEAVDRLAREAGVEVTRDGLHSEARESQRARADAYAALAAAQEFFVEQLLATAAATDVLRAREVKRRIAGQLGIGFAPDSSRALIERLADQGIPISTMIDAGLVHQPDEPGRSPFAFFRGRITFPIRNSRGEVIAFGARALGDEKPKYLNSPATALFDKGRTLYNLDRARPAISRSGVAIVVEGYLDVTTAAQAGVENIVAPLGTALTVEHLHALWRVAPMIVVATDGDAAGVRAGNRTLETALPWVAGDRRLTFANLPAGVDPDDLVRASGAEAFHDVLRNAQALVDRMWQWLRTDIPGDGPEDRAQLETEISQRLAVVSDPHMRRAYGDELGRRARRLGMARPQLGPGGLARRLAPAIPAREAALVLAALTHPGYVDSDLERLATVRVTAPACAQLRDMVCATAAAAQVVDPQEETVARQMAVLRQALPQPAPRFVTAYDPVGFRAALDLQDSQGARLAIRGAYQASV